MDDLREIIDTPPITTFGVIRLAYQVLYIYYYFYIKMISEIC
jgi:hypothetical protein